MNALLGGAIGAGLLFLILRQIQPQTVDQIIAEATGQPAPTQTTQSTPTQTTPGGGIDYIEPGAPLPVQNIPLPTVRLIGGGYTYYEDLFRDPFRVQSPMELERDNAGTGQHWI